MTEVENVALGLSRIVQHGFDPLFQAVLGQKEGQRVKITLHSMGAGPKDGFFERQTPIETKDISACCGGQSGQSGPVVGKINQRDVGHAPQVGDDRLHIRQGKLFVIARSQDAGPGIEQLQGLGTCTCLRLQVGTGAGGDLQEQAMVELRLLKHHFFCLEEDPRTASFDQVGGQGEGRSGKSDQRHLEFAP